MQKSRISHKYLYVLLLGAAYLCIGWADTWEGIRNTAGKVTTVSAEFIQEKHMKILFRPLVSKGVFYFRSPNSLRWEYQAPVKSIMLLHRGKTTRYIEKNGTITEEDGVNLPFMQMMLKEITRWIEGRFDENRAFQAQLAPDRMIVLRPKEKNTARMIQQIEIRLSDRPSVIKSVTIYEGENSFTRLEFKKVILNPPLKEALFNKIP